MRKVISVLVIFTLLLSVMTSSAYMASSKSTFSAAKEVYGTLLLRSAKDKSAAPIVKVFSEKKVVVYMREYGTLNHLTEAFVETVTKKATLSKDKKKLTMSTTSEYGKREYVFTKDAKGLWQLTVNFDGGTTIGKSTTQQTVQRVTKLSDAIAIIKKDKITIERHKKELEEIKAEKNKPAEPEVPAAVDTSNDPASAENPLWGDYIGSKKSYEMKIWRDVANALTMTLLYPNGKNISELQIGLEEPEYTAAASSKSVSVRYKGVAYADGNEIGTVVVSLAASSASKIEALTLTFDDPANKTFEEFFKGITYTKKTY